MNQRAFARLMEDTFRRLDTETRIDDSAEEAWATAATDIERLGRWLREGSPPRFVDIIEDIIESLFEVRFYLDHDPDEVEAGGAVAKSGFVAGVFTDEILAPWKGDAGAARGTFARFQQIDRAYERGLDRKAMLWSSVMVRCNWVQLYFADRDVRGTINDLVVWLFRLYGMLVEEEARYSVVAEEVAEVPEDVWEAALERGGRRERDGRHHPRTGERRMNEGEQDGLLGEARILMKEAAGAFFDGNIYRAVHLADVVYVLAWLANTNPTREGLDALMSRLAYITDALEHYLHNTAERDV